MPEQTVPSTLDPHTRPGELRGSTAFGNTILDALPPAGPLGPSSPFDVCHVGVVLRAVLFVHGVVAIGVAFVSADLIDWFIGVATASAVALPAVLLWLVVACVGKTRLARLSESWQWGAAVALGAFCGLYGWWQLQLSGVMPMDEWRWLAPLLAGAAISAAIFHWLRLRARGALPAATAARLAELQSRIRPHFLFNTLNTAIALVRLDPGRAETVLEDLSELFRVALTHGDAPVTLGEEVELAQRYLAIEQIRFGERLKVQWELDEVADDAKLPPLLLQPLVENAVKHGIEPSPAGGVIRVRSRVKRGHAVVSVTNTLPPVPGLPGHGMALRNVRERLRLMHDVAAQFDAGVQGDLYRVQIVVPL